MVRRDVRDKWYVTVFGEPPDVVPPDNGQAIGVHWSAEHIATSEDEIHLDLDLARLDGERRSSLFGRAF